MRDESELLPISAIQHLLFCERQAALIHLERLWAENRLTVEGARMHKKTHDPRRSASRPGVRVERGLQLASHRLGLFGVADVVEFPLDDPDGPPVPIEYKRGRPKKHDADKVQLCAQAMALEEMLELDIPAGAIFYGRTRRRLDVSFDSTLRRTTENAACRLHEIIATGQTPLARREKKCDRCSLLNLCMPDALRPQATAQKYLADAVQRSLERKKE